MTTTSKTYARTCEMCGDNFEAGTPWARFCPGCRKIRKRQAASKWQKDNPEASRAILKRFQATDKFRNYQREYRKSRCTVCGLMKDGPNQWRGRARQSRPPFVCGACRAVRRRETVYCYICDSPFTTMIIKDKESKHRCPDCYGSYTRFGIRWGITDERVRQLVNKNYQVGHGTRKDVLLRLDQERMH